ncbi:hypothetical protein [Falsiroseomonas sp. E2-1-a20]|uniref:hypothetical protein n=1 Tax=Falsiroseomonas sp. E2-1-a20 TaxID=3239300 RepID=UPI003F2E12D0
MVDPEDREAFHQTLEREAWRIAATGSPSDAGQLVMQSVATSIAAALPEASSEMRASVASKALLVLAETEWDAAVNAMAAVLLSGTNKLVMAHVLAGGNVVTTPERGA